MSNRELIEKIYLLESRLGKQRSYSILEPFIFDSSDPIKVQAAAKRIARHLDLPSLTFVITYAQQKQNIGGHIELDGNNDVFIEIEYKFKNDCNIVLSILAHEICHKYLYINGIQLFPEYENEMLTDAATIYTGLGKFSLNGCEKSNISSTKKSSRVIKHITTQKIGYMNREQFAFSYLLVCEMYKTPLQTVFSGLIKDVVLELEHQSKTESPYFNKKYFKEDLTLKKMTTVLNNEIEEVHRNLAVFNKNIRLADILDLTPYIRLYKDYHIFIKSKTELLNSFLTVADQSVSLTYIKNIAAEEEIIFLKSEIARQNKELKKMNNALCSFSSQQLIKKDPEILLRFECPSCSNKMRIGKNTLAKIKCPDCNYSFMVDTTINETDLIGSGIFNKILSLLKKWSNRD